ncbi:pyridoxamine 5'-phosphate oxidase family protein [Parafrankia elaeagni]|uniref:hypothetical protein n=1 Tax=Parafrankia elaeagni TaxID=222534 RepID=UPI00035C3E95|nr:hypothetical protein [Parafrankia elaeagni]
MSSGLPQSLKDLVASGPSAHLSTINADGSPQVSVMVPYSVQRIGGVGPWAPSSK